jgi:hypothetical protein
MLQMAHQGPAALGIALVAMSEELGTAMAHRALEHLLQYGEPPVRQAFCAAFVDPHIVVQHVQAYCGPPRMASLLMAALRALACLSVHQSFRSAFIREAGTVRST